MGKSLAGRSAPLSESSLGTITPALYSDFALFDGKLVGQALKRGYFLVDMLPIHS